MMYLTLLLASLLASSPADGMSCRVVKYAVAQYGETVTEAWARAKGFSDKDIERAKRCLKS